MTLYEKRQKSVANHSCKEITRDASTPISEGKSHLQIVLAKKQLGMHQKVIKRKRKLFSFIHGFL